jgi:hypothetical protein
MELRLCSGRSPNPPSAALSSTILRIVWPGASSAPRSQASKNWTGERDRIDVAQRRARWRSYQDRIETEGLVFIGTRHRDPTARDLIEQILPHQKHLLRKAPVARRRNDLRCNCSNHRRVNLRRTGEPFLKFSSHAWIQLQSCIVISICEIDLEKMRASTLQKNNTDSACARYALLENCSNLRCMCLRQTGEPFLKFSSHAWIQLRSCIAISVVRDRFRKKASELIPKKQESFSVCARYALFQLQSCIATSLA